MPTNFRRTQVGIPLLLVDKVLLFQNQIVGAEQLPSCRRGRVPLREPLGLPERDPNGYPGQNRVAVQGPEMSPVYWLNGLAGTGKSTIAQTIAEHIFADGGFGAPFCSRDFKDRRDLPYPRLPTRPQLNRVSICPGTSPPIKPRRWIRVAPQSDATLIIEPLVHGISRRLSSSTHWMSV